MKTKVIIVCSVLFLVLIISFSLFTVSENECVIITRFGRPTRVLEDAGLEIKWPGFIEKVNRIDKRINIFKTLPIQLLLGDKNPIIVTMFISWCVKDPVLYFQSVSVFENAERKLSDMVTSQLGSVLGDYALNNIINTDSKQVQLAKIEMDIKTNCNQKAPIKYGVEVVEMGIQRITYPSVVAKAVYNRMRAEREKEAKKYRAEGSEAAAKIEAETDSKVAEILADAYKKAEIIKGEGDRKAMHIYADAYGKHIEFFEFLESLKTYEKVLKTKSTLVLSTDSDLFKYLQPSDQK